MKKQIKSKEKLLKSGCEESDRKARVEKIAHILEAVRYPTSTDRVEAVISLSKSTLSEEEIEKVIKPLRSDYTEGQIYKRGTF